MQTYGGQVTSAGKDLECSHVGIAASGQEGRLSVYVILFVDQYLEWRALADDRLRLSSHERDMCRFDLFLVEGNSGSRVAQGIDADAKLLTNLTFGIGC